ncbi:UNVERIFIED_CONTAM: hypothetical protein FKN15_050817 [Acipenser sinensis]
MHSSSDFYSNQENEDHMGPPKMTKTQCIQCGQYVQLQFQQAQDYKHGARTVKGIIKKESLGKYNMTIGNETAGTDDSTINKIQYV